MFADTWTVVTVMYYYVIFMALIIWHCSNELFMHCTRSAIKSLVYACTDFYVTWIVNRTVHTVASYCGSARLICIKINIFEFCVTWHLSTGLFWFFVFMFCLFLVACALFLCLVSPRSIPVICIAVAHTLLWVIVSLNAGASIPMGQGGHVPPIFGLGGTLSRIPPSPIFLE